MSVTQMLASLGAEWFAFKTFTRHATDISHDALHVIAGPVIQIAAAAMLRGSLRNIRPWLIVLAFELLNEWNDLRVNRWPNLAEQLGEGAKDLALTMALPTLLFVLARWLPGLLTRRDQAR